MAAGMTVRGGGYVNSWPPWDEIRMALPSRDDWSRPWFLEVEQQNGMIVIWGVCRRGLSGGGW